MTEQGDEAALERLRRLMADVQAGRLSEAELTAALAGDAELRALAQRLIAGGGAQGSRSGITFGPGGNFGDVNIGDVAGRDIVNVTINSPGTTARTAQPPDEAAHKRELIALHRKVLNTLELRAAQFGIHTPPYITIEIEELKAKIAQLQRELGDR